MQFMVVAEDYIFWVDGEERTISRIKRDLTERETLIPNESIYGVEGLVVDWVAGENQKIFKKIIKGTVRQPSLYSLVHDSSDEHKTCQTKKKTDIGVFFLFFPPTCQKE